MSDDGGPAFPASVGQTLPGMSLRDWFAGQALPAMIGRLTEIVGKLRVDAARESGGIGGPAAFAAFFGSEVPDVSSDAFAIIVGRQADRSHRRWLNKCIALNQAGVWCRLECRPRLQRPRR